MYFTLLGQKNSLKSWKDKLRSDTNIPTGIVAVDLNVSQTNCFQVYHGQLSNQGLKYLVDIRKKSTNVYPFTLLNNR